MAITTNDKNLGHATAYAYAKSKGYTGTEEEFAELMASYATVAESAEESRQAAEVAQGKAEDAQAAAEAAQGVAVQAKDTAVGAKDTAVSAATTATTKAGEASASATSASESATVAAGSASSAAGSASAASGSAATATTKAGEASNSAIAAIAAQEAAEDAQEASEQAAASVSASAVQIDTNTEDIGDLKSALNASVPRIAELRSEYELGKLDDSGQPSTATNRWRTKDFLAVDALKAHYIAIPGYGRAYIYQYDNNKTYMSGKAIGWFSTAGVQSVTLDPACAFIKLVVSHTNGTAGNEYLVNLISMYEVNNLSISQASPTFTVHYGTLFDGRNEFNANYANTRAHSTFIPVDKTKKAVKVTIPTSLLAYIWQFDSSFQFVREDGWVDTTWLKGIEDNTEYVVITYKDKVNGSNPVDLAVAVQTTVEFINVEKFKPNDLLGEALLWAHRGANATAPENTLPAIELAIQQGYKAIEIDLEFTSDNVCVLLHDKTIDRTSNGTGNIYDMTYAQALTYDFGSWKSAEYAGTKIPTLEEALLLCKRHNVVLQLDIADTSKTNITATNLAEMCRVIKETGMIRNVTVCAYHERFRQVLALLPAICITFGLQSLATAKFTDLAWLSSLATYSENKSSITTTNINLFHNLGYMCQTWEVDTTTDYDNYFDNYSVDWMITNTLTPSEVI